MLLPDLPLTVLDTETTGFIPRVNRVIEFASLQVLEGKITNEYECLIGIPTEIPAYIETITRIYNKDIVDKPPFEELRSEIEARIGTDTIIVGQNIQFDIRMLKGEGVDLSERSTLDTSMLASLVFPEFASYSLPYMSELLKLDHAPVHRALGDVRATTQLLSKCWERLHELTPQMYADLQNIMQRAPSAYKQLFALVPEPVASSPVPTWLTQKSTTVPVALEPLVLPDTAIDHVQLVEQSLNKHTIARIVRGLPQEPDHTHIIAVANLDQCSPLDHIEGVGIIEAATSILDVQQKENLLAQTAFTDDEATLAVKLLWFTPTTKDDMPLHGGEKDICKSRLACHEQSSQYLAQFTKLPPIAILSHWQLLRLINTPANQIGLIDQASQCTITVENATLLEDTATKAFGHMCDCHLVRVASTGTPELEAFVDVLQLWLERIRNAQDILFIDKSILNALDAVQIRSQLTQLLEQKLYGNNTTLQNALESLQYILDPSEFTANIVWLELGRDDRQIVHSVPKLIAAQLQSKLYDRFAVRLLVPPTSDTSLATIVPNTTETTLVPNDYAAELTISHDSSINGDQIFKDPPAGKTIVVVGGRKRLEDVYIAYTESLEAQGVTLLCQGFSGGMGRMQAEFDAHEGDIIMVLSGFQVEAMHLQRAQVGQFFIESLPFDHPNHPIVSKRGELFNNAFMDYSLPRLEQRLYRICKIFAAIALPGATITVLDARISTKKYGAHIAAFLEDMNPMVDTVHKSNEPPQMSLL